jgi:hypothetical protein
LCFEAALFFRYPKPLEIVMIGRTAVASLFRKLVFLGAIPLSMVPMQRTTLAEDPAFVRYACMDAVEPVSGVDNPAGTPGLPPSLVIAPGQYAFHGKTYDLRKQGLYRFICPFKENQQRIVYRAHSGNVEALLSGLAWCVSHGNSDNSKSQEELTRKATTGKLFITCSNISQWALPILQSYKIRARTADTLTLDEWNSYDNGHNMIEVYREDLKKWVLYDLDANVCFLHNKTPLSLVEVIEYAASGDYEFKLLALDTRLDVSNFKSPRNGYDWGFSAELTRTDEGSRGWYKRVLQVPVIGNCFFLTSPNDANRARVESYAGAKFTTKEEFLRKFY